MHADLTQTFANLGAMPCIAWAGHGPAPTEPAPESPDV